MKKFQNTLFFFLIATSTVVLSGCKLIDELRTFDMDFQSSFSVPGNTLLNIPLNIPTPPITTNSEDRFDTEGIAVEWIDEIRMKHITLVITAPSGETFSFLESVNVYINASGQPQLLLASKTPVIEPTTGTLEMDVSGEDLRNYVAQSEFVLNTVVTTDESIIQQVEVDVLMTVEVKATIPK